MKNKRRWFEFHDNYLIAWLAMGVVVGFSGNPKGLGGFGAGLNVGMAIQVFFNRKSKRLMERGWAQDTIDIRTMSQIVGRMTYRTLHEVERAGMN